MQAPNTTQQAPTAAPVTSYGPPTEHGQADHTSIGMPVRQVNDVVQQVDAAHKRLFGVRANPGLVYDVARGVQQGLVQRPAAQGTHDFLNAIDDLFNVPTSSQDAKVRLTHAQLLGQESNLYGKLGQQAKPVDSSIDLNKPNEIQTVPYGRGVTMTKPVVEKVDPYKVAVDYALRADQPLGAEVRESALLAPSGAIFGAGLKQIFVGGLINAFPGMYYLGKAATLDARDFAYKVERDYLHLPVQRPVPAKDMHADRLATIAKQYPHILVRDFTHADNWGYALLDASAIFSMGAGLGTRILSTGARAADFERASVAAQQIATARSGNVADFIEARTPGALKAPKTEKVLQAIEGFRKPDVHPGFRLSVGTPTAANYTENFGAFENAGLRWAQGQYFKWAQGKLDAADVDPAAFAISGPRFDPKYIPDAVYENLFSPENLLRRGAVSRMNIEWGIAMSPLVEMSRLTNWTSRTASAIEMILSDPGGGHVGFHPGKTGTLRAQQRIGVEKAIQMIMTDHEDPLTLWRNHHARMMNDANEQKAQFLAINPSEAERLRAQHDLHTSSAEALTSQADELAAGHKMNIPLSDAEGFARFPVPTTPSLREEARGLLSNGFEKPVVVRNRNFSADERATIADLQDKLYAKEQEWTAQKAKVEAAQGNRGRQGMNAKLNRLESERSDLEKQLTRFQSKQYQRLATEEDHRTVAAARLAGIQDIPVQFVEVGEKEIAALRAAAKEQRGLANKIKPDMKAAERIAGLTKGQREREIDAFDYRIASHQAQLKGIDLAEEILKRPPKRFKAIVDKAYEISREQEFMKEIVYGFDPEVGNQHLAEIVARLSGDKLRPIVDEEGNQTGLGRVVPGPVPDDELRKAVREGTAGVKREQRRLETLQLRRAKPTARGKEAAARPKLDEQIAAQEDRLVTARASLEQALQNHESQGSKLVPLERSVHGYEVPRASGYYNTRTGETIWGNVGEHHEGLMIRTGRSTAGNDWKSLQAAYDKIDSEGWKQFDVRIGDDEIKAEGILPGEIPAADIAKLQAEAEQRYKAQQGIVKGRAGRGSAYFGPMEREPYRIDRNRGGNLSATPTRRRNKFGLAVPKNQTMSHVRSTGEAIEIGDFRWDTSKLLADEYKRVFKGAMAHVSWKDMWDIGKPSRTSSFDMPIRDIQSVPEALRKVVAALESHVIDSDLAKLLSEENMTDLKSYLFPDEDKLTTNDHPHVRYFDSRLFLNRFGGNDQQFWTEIDRAMGGAFKYVNQPFRVLTIFASPAYILNAGGAAVTLAVEHGFASPGLFGRALAAEHIYGSEASRLMDTLAGSTHAASLVTETGRGVLGKGEQVLSEYWQKATDRRFRKAALIGELEKRGLLHDGMSQEEVTAMLKSGMSPMLGKLGRATPEEAAQGRLVIEAAQTARKQMLDFERMTWFERSILRHMFFVYAFLRAGSVWSFRYLAEHPVQADVFAHSGEERKKDIAQFIGKVPEWFNQTPYIPYAPGHVWNPIQFDMPATAAQVAYPLASLFGNAPYSSLSDIFGPVSTIGSDLATGKNSSDQALPGGHGRLVGSLLDIMESTPIGRTVLRQEKAAKQAKQTYPPLPTHLGLETGLQDALGRERSFLKLSPFDVTGFWNQWGRNITRTAGPIGVNNFAMNARYWRDLRNSDMTAYMQHQLDAMFAVAHKQAQILGMKSVPTEVQNALGLIGHYQMFVENWKLKNNQSNPGHRQLGAVTINFLRQEGLISDTKASTYRSQIQKVRGSTSAHGLYLKWLRDAGGQAWADWQAKVDQVNYFNTDNFTAVVNRLKDSGLGDYSQTFDAKPDVKYAYGRQFSNYHEKLKKLQADAAQAKDKYEHGIAAQKILQLADAASKEVKVNGVTFPPFEAVKFGKLNPDKQAARLRALALANWTGLDNFSRKLLTGQDTDPSVRQGYALVAEALAHYGEKLKVGEHLPPNAKSFYENYYSELAAKNGNPAFRNDLIFAGAIPEKDGSYALRADQLATMTPIAASPYKAQWETLLQGVRDVFNQMVGAGGGYVTHTGKPNYSIIADQWRTYYVPTKVKPWLQQQSPGFQREVNTYMSEHNHFLEGLIKRG